MEMLACTRDPPCISPTCGRLRARGPLYDLQPDFQLRQIFIELLTISINSQIEKREPYALVTFTNITTIVK